MSLIKLFFLFLILFIVSPSVVLANSKIWTIQSVDTMKESRDQAREKITDLEYDAQIDLQMQQIASLGATHVSIATPYDEEFLPFLKRWVDSARNHNLAVWFRGNWSGWEGWFDYPKITANNHLVKTRNFILNNQDLFKNGDIFSACPECENGGPGDPRQTGKTSEFRSFLINLNKTSHDAFSKINKKVTSEIFCHNKDVSDLVMDKKTTKNLGNTICVDHYVSSAEKFGSDLHSLGTKSATKIVVGEFGAPIPDLNGKMTESEQAQFIDHLLAEMYRQKDSISGLNYWTLTNGSTAILNSDLSFRQAGEVIKNYYRPAVIKGTVKNTLDEPLANVAIKIATAESLKTGKNGQYEFLVPAGQTEIIFVLPDYKDFSQKTTLLSDKAIEINPVLSPINPSLLYRIRLLLK